jgi:dTDP-4-amino-4,6-dideoxygalactose transaminase
MTPEPFPEPVYVTRPIVPDLARFQEQLADVWRSRQLTNAGPKHALLERRLREHLRVPELSLFNNGTIALVVAVQSLRLSGEAITTPFTFPATPHVLAWNNIRPIFCDIDPVTMNIDPAKIEELITPGTTAILGVHVFGTPCAHEAIQEVANRYGLRVIYDAAHAFGVEVEGRGIGTFGDITMFSFHATKLFHTAEGGALAVADPALKRRIDLLKNFGIKDEETVMMPGINGKMNEVQAALGLCMLDIIEEERERRRALSLIYRERLAALEGITVMPDPPGVRQSYQYFVARVDARRFGISRDEVHRRLKAYNIFSRRYFYPLCSRYPCYRQVPTADPARLPVATRVESEVLCLPLFGDLGADGVARICDAIAALRP